MSFVLLIGDPHFTEENEMETDILLKNVLLVLKTREIDLVVIMGDVLHDHEKIDTYCYLRVQRFIEQVSETHPLVILIGNHDRPNNRVFLTNEHVFGPYKRWENVLIVDDCCQVFDWKDKKLVFSPYVYPGRLFQAYAASGIVDFKNYDVFFGHSEIKGCSMNGLSKTVTDEWPEDFPLAIHGHDHGFQVVQDNLIYIGTPFQQNFGEAGDKGIFLLNDDLELEMISLTIPKKVSKTIHYTELDSVQVNPNEKLRLIINGPKHLTKDILLNPEFVKKFKGVKIVYRDETKKKKKTIVNFAANVPFIDRLISGLSKDEKLKRIFYETFSEST